MPELDIQANLRELVEGEVEFLLIGGRPEDLADLQRLREARES